MKLSHLQRLYLGPAVIEAAAFDLVMECFPNHDPAISLWPMKLRDAVFKNSPGIILDAVVQGYERGGMPEAITEAKGLLMHTDVAKDMMRVLERTEADKNLPGLYAESLARRT